MASKRDHEFLSNKAYFLISLIVEKLSNFLPLVYSID